VNYILLKRQLAAYWERKFMLFKVYLRQSVGVSSRPKPSKSVRPYTGGGKWCKQCEGSRIHLNNDSSWSSMISIKGYLTWLEHTGYGLSKPTALGFASKGIKTCNVHGCELARKSWEGVNDFRLTDWLYLHNQTLQINSEIENYNVQDRKELTH